MVKSRGSCEVNAGKVKASVLELLGWWETDSFHYNVHLTAPQLQKAVTEAAELHVFLGKHQ